MYLDVHCHLDIMSDIDKVIENARKAKVLKIISTGTNPQSNRKILELIEKYAEVEAALGIYPIDALKMNKKEIIKEKEFIKKNKNKLKVIGEVGIDLKESNELDKQIEIFSLFIKLATELNVPLVVHSRKAEKECIESLENLKAKKVIMHCFCGKFSLVDRIIKNGWVISIPASVKRSEQFQNIVKRIPIENILCETDSPFLHPDKEDVNEPCNVIESYKKIAEIKNLNLKKIESIIEDNWKNLNI